MRTTLSALAIVTALTLGVIWGLKAPFAPPGPGPDTGQVVVVEPGDTLWSIAKEHYPNRDPRPVVDRMTAQLGGRSAIWPGERITLP